MNKETPRSFRDAALAMSVLPAHEVVKRSTCNFDPDSEVVFFKMTDPNESDAKLGTIYGVFTIFSDNSLAVANGSNLDLKDKKIAHQVKRHDPDFFDIENKVEVNLTSAKEKQARMLFDALAL